jgi:hypothetical protein
MPGAKPAAAASGIMVQFLAWIAARPRTYADAMEAWRTSCPRLSVWEDAVGEGLVRVEGEGAATHGQAAVLLTPLGVALLAAAAQAPAPQTTASTGP